MSANRDERDAITDSPQGRAAWVNWNPDPEIHTLDRVLPRGVAVATCGVTVRKQLAEPFDPTHPKTCEDCAAGRKRSGDLTNAIVCRRPA